LVIFYIEYIELSSNVVVPVNILEINNLFNKVALLFIYKNGLKYVLIS